MELAWKGSRLECLTSGFQPAEWLKVQGVSLTSYFPEALSSQLQCVCVLESCFSRKKDRKKKNSGKEARVGPAL